MTKLEINALLDRDETYPVEVEVRDGVIRQTFQTTARCTSSTGDGQAPNEP